MKRKILILALCAAVLAAAAFIVSLSVRAEEYDYTDPDEPYIATDFNGLFNVFTKKRTDSAPRYIKLGNDIIRTVSKQEGIDIPRESILAPDGAPIVLDLAGYKLGVTSEFRSGLIYGWDDAGVTIEDSKRYDPSKKEWIEGRLEFRYDYGVFESSYVLKGKIVVKGGLIKNNTHVDSDFDSERYHDAVYIGKDLEMYGGSFEADFPVFIRTLSPFESFEKCVIHDGTFRVNRNVALLSDGNSFTSDAYPVIERCEIVNASGNDRVVAFYLDIGEEFAETHTASDAFAIWNSISSPYNYAFINGVKRAQGDHGVIYNGIGALFGPQFGDSYILTPLNDIDTLQLNIEEPQAGNVISYSAFAPAGHRYQVEKYNSGTSWMNGVRWGYYDEPNGSVSHALSCASTIRFDADVGCYTVSVMVEVKDKYREQFADVSYVSATVNGRKAKVYDNGDGTLTVKCDFTVTNVIGSVSAFLPEPKAGDSIPYTAIVPTGARYALSDYNDVNYKNGVYWVKNGSPLLHSNPGVFEYGNKYTAYVLIRPDAGFVFAPAGEITAGVNGVQADRVVDYGKYGYALVYTFDMTNIIGSVDLTIPEPDAGDRLQWTASAPEGADYEVADKTSGVMAKGVMWYKGTAAITPDKNVSFEALEEYRVVIRIKAINGHSFAGDDMISTVNGKEATVSGRYSDTDILIAYKFTAKKQIRSLDITLPALTAGEKITYGFTLPDGCGFKNAGKVFDSDDEYWKNGIRWTQNGEPLPNNKSYTFVAGNKYVAVIAVDPTGEPQFEYADISDMKVTVNGNPAKIERSVYCCLVSFTFTVPDGTPVVLVGDCNSDGKVTSLDIVRLKKHLASSGVSIGPGSDVNLDEKVDALDVARLKRYFAEYDVKTGKSTVKLGSD